MESSNHRTLAAVELSGVSKLYAERTVLGPVSVSFHPGERVAVIGPSGSGKTTLLRAISGMLRPTNGEVKIHGKDVVDIGPGPELAGLVGIIAQQFDLIPNLSSLHNVLAGRLGHWSLLRSIVSLIWPRERTSAITALDRVGIADLLHQRAGRLSGGEQQRVAIARLLVQAPKVILADEPVSSLDPSRAKEVVKLLISITEERRATLISSLHALDLAQQFFDRIIGLKAGQVVFDCPASDVTASMLDTLYHIQEETLAI